MKTYKELMEATLTLARKPAAEEPAKKQEPKKGPGYEPGKSHLTLNPEIRRGFGAHEADPNAAHPNQGKANNHSGRAEYHYGWEVVHTTHGKDRMTGGRSSTLALPGKFDNPHDNNKDFTHRMIRGIHHRRLNQESEVRFRSREHDQTVVTNVNPHKKQIRVITVLPKGRHSKGASSNKDMQIHVESKEDFIIIDVDDY